MNIWPQTYGFEHVPLLIHLQSLSLLTRAGTTSSTKSPFALARKPLRLVVDDVDEQDPRDISYVFSGYAPLSVRLVQCALGKDMTLLNGWKGIEDVLKGFEGPSFEMVQKTSDEDRNKGERIDRRPCKPDSSFSALARVFRLIRQDFFATMHAVKGQIPTTIVCYLGGITYAEIAALRFLNRQTPGRNLLIVTTGCVQGSSLLQSLMPEPAQVTASSSSSSSSS